MFFHYEIPRCHHTGFPHSSVVKESACNARRPGFDSWVGKIPWRKKWQPTPGFLPRESPWTEDAGRLQSMGSQESDMTWRLHHHHHHARAHAKRSDVCT